MLPTYQPGEVLLGARWFRPGVGQVVVIKTLDRFLIKRITRLEGDKIWVEGDNKAASTDSRTQGHFDRRQLVARILLKIAP